MQLGQCLDKLYVRTNYLTQLHTIAVFSFPMPNAETRVAELIVASSGRVAFTLLTALMNTLVEYRLPALPAAKTNTEPLPSLP